MEFNKMVSNPMLVGAMELMRSEPNAQHNNTLIGEIVNAKLISPAMIVPEPLVDPAGNMKIANGSRIHFSMLTTPEELTFVPAFTDAEEAQKWMMRRTDKEMDVKVHMVALTYDDYMNMIFNQKSATSPRPTAGVVINPFGINLVLSRENMMTIQKARIKK